MELPVLYSFRRCPYAIRARLALVASARQVELREVLLRSKPAEMLAASPKGTVPVLIDVGGAVIEESLDIMLWALQRNDPEHWLPSDEAKTQEVLSLIHACDGEFKQALDRYKYPTRYVDINPIEQRERGVAFLRILQSRLQDQAWLVAERPGLADFAILPFVRQFSLVDAAWFQQQKWPELDRWLRMLTRSAVFAAAMDKHPLWQTGQSGRLFPADGAIAFD